jgi:hypothetical protein
MKKLLIKLALALAAGVVAYKSGVVSKDNIKKILRK